MDAALIQSVLHALKARGVRFKVVGGVALNLIGLPRATRDLDLFVAADDDNIARLRAALRELFEDPSIDEISAADLRGPYPAIQYVPPQEGFHIDILHRLGDAFTFEDVETEDLDVAGVPVPVATPRMLVRMKAATVRLQDRADAERIRKHFRIEEG